MSIIIEGIGIEKSFENGGVQHQVLKGVSIKIEEGEFVAIMGRSGAGKSTLLYQLSLLDRPTRGEVIIEGEMTQELTPAKRTSLRLEKLGYVFQDYALVPELSAEENVIVPLLMLGESKHSALRRAREVLDLVELGSKYQNLPSQLSGGEQQRVAIARAIAHQPKILFADEPTANLDSEVSHHVLDIFRKLNEQQGLTVVMVTHEKEYGEIADRVVTIHDGSIVSYR